MEQYSDEELWSELSARMHKTIQAKSEQLNLLKELEAVNKKLKDSERLKTNFLSNIRNEIINPFTSILSLSKMILSIDSTNIEKIRAMISLIHLESFELDFQFKNIFAAAAIEAGEFYPDYSNVNINALLHETVKQFSSKADQKQIDVQIEKNEEEYSFVTDPEKFQLIVSNLLSNAIKYSHAAGEVKISAVCENDQLLLTVQDKGIGFDKVSEEEIFNRFTQLDSGLTRSYGGHGLGLSVTRSAVELLEGEIKVSGKKNAGCVVTILLPQGSHKKQFLDESESGNEIFFHHSEKF
ncbi:MAG TPA: HAMP domain-containing sensor histidine kinase [Cytophagaceae bacterium]|nr:HAMP domain-containing sensor histidine kinase [Cytophagaceae bacterium]